MSVDVTPDASPDPTVYAIEEILALMGRRRLTRTELARRLSVSDVWVGRRLNDQVPIDLRELQRIAVVLGVELADLLPRPSSERITRSSVDPLGERVLATVGQDRSRRLRRRHRPGRAVTRTRPVTPLPA